MRAAYGCRPSSRTDGGVAEPGDHFAACTDPFLIGRSELGHGEADQVGFARDAVDQGDRGFDPEIAAGIGEIWELLRIEDVEVEMDMHRPIDGFLRIQSLQIQLAPPASVSTSAVLTDGDYFAERLQ